MFETADVRPPTGRMEGLTRREAEVIHLVSQGFANKAIALRLGLREGTVKIHLHNIYQKLRVANRTALILRSTAERAQDPQ